LLRLMTCPSESMLKRGPRMSPDCSFKPTPHGTA
jgi:hypothetical protein